MTICNTRWNEVLKFVKPQKKLGTLRVLYQGQRSYLRKSVDFLKSVVGLLWLSRISSLTYKTKCPMKQTNKKVGFIIWA